MPQFPAAMAAGAIAKGLSGQFDKLEEQRKAAMGQPSLPNAASGQGQGQQIGTALSGLWSQLQGPKSQVNISSATGESVTPSLIPNNMMGQPNPLIPQQQGNNQFLEYIKKIFGG